MRSALAGVINALVEASAGFDLSPENLNVRLVNSAMVPKPSPAANVPKDTTLAILDDGTALSLAFSLN
jgi:hypothetical protein